MIFVTRGPSQSIYISLAPDIDPLTPIGELFKDGPIRVRVIDAREAQVRLGIQLSPLLEVHRAGQPENATHPDLA
jgi:Global regulator protein family